jgi:hypothetical protein
VASQAFLPALIQRVSWDRTCWSAFSIMFVALQ